MKVFLNSVISSDKHDTSPVPDSADRNTANFIISGYSPALSADQPEGMSPDLNHKLAGILYADIVDYSRLTEQDEEGTHLRLVEGMTTMKHHVIANEGRIAHFAGDAILAEFKDADSALHCAINVQLSAQQWNANLSSDQRMLFRIGVNFGDVIADHGDIFGNAVNLAARLEKLAQTGGICVSESVRQRLEDHSSFKFIAMGKQYLKNISEPVQAFWIEFDAEQVVNGDYTRLLKVSAMVS